MGPSERRVGGITVFQTREAANGFCSEELSYRTRCWRWSFSSVTSTHSFPWRAVSSPPWPCLVYCLLRSFCSTSESRACSHGITTVTNSTQTLPHSGILINMNLSSRTERSLYYFCIYTGRLLLPAVSQMEDVAGDGWRYFYICWHPIFSEIWLFF